MSTASSTANSAREQDQPIITRLWNKHQRLAVYGSYHLGMAHVYDLMLEDPELPTSDRIKLIRAIQSHKRMEMLEHSGKITPDCPFNVIFNGRYEAGITQLSFCLTAFSCWCLLWASMALLHL